MLCARSPLLADCAALFSRVINTPVCKLPFFGVIEPENRSILQIDVSLPCRWIPLSFLVSSSRWMKLMRWLIQRRDAFGA